MANDARSRNKQFGGVNKMQIYNDELRHYGVKGMKWGHHRIKAGTTVQRITDNKDEKKNGRTYVSFKYLDINFSPIELLHTGHP